MALTGVLSDIGLRLDPPLNHNFLVLMADTSSASSLLTSGLLSLAGDALLGAFSEVSGLEMVLEEEKLHEGGLNHTEHRFPTRMTWPNIKLQRGVSRVSQSGWDWLYGIGHGKVKRMDGIIMLMDRLHIPHNVWTFKNAFPVHFTGPTMKGGGNEVAIETLELVHEGLWQLSVLKEAAGVAGISI
jgi:phage tail-like protein